MILDIFFTSLIAAAVVLAVVYDAPRLKGIWIIGALLYIAGGIMTFLAVYLIFYPLVADTHYVFLPGAAGFLFWSFVCLRLFTGETSAIH